MEPITYAEVDFARLVPHPGVEDNKYSRGIVHIVGGSVTYPGAAALAARAAQRSGDGYTQVWSAPDAVHDVRAGRPSLVVRPWDSLDLARALRRDASRNAAVLVGPGTDGSDVVTRDLLEIALDSRLPTVVDAGALGALAALAAERSPQQLDARLGNNAPLVLTPHAGEARRLCEGIGENPGSASDIAEVLARAYHAIVALKGPDTLIVGNGRRYLMREGTPALAKAGTGDVLAGIVAALLAQGLDAFDAAALGTLLHARAGSCAAEKLTDVSVIPEDVIAFIPEAIRKTR